MTPEEKVRLREIRDTLYYTPHVEARSKIIDMTAEAVAILLQDMDLD